MLYFSFEKFSRTKLTSALLNITFLFASVNVCINLNKLLGIFFSSSDIYNLDNQINNLIALGYNYKRSIVDSETIRNLSIFETLVCDGFYNPFIELYENYLQLYDSPTHLEKCYEDDEVFTDYCGKYLENCVDKEKTSYHLVNMIRNTRITYLENYYEEELENKK